MAVEVLKSRGVPEDHILFLNLIASPEGIKKFADEYPKVRVVTAFVDQGLDEKKYVLDRLSNVLADQDLVTSFQVSATLAIASTPCKAWLTKGTVLAAFTFVRHHHWQPVMAEANIY